MKYPYALRGSLELAVFLKQGLIRFEDTQKSALRSLAVPFFLMPLAAVFSTTAPENTDKPYATLLLNVELSWTLSSALFLALLYALLPVIKDRTHFWRFFAIYNWINIPGMLIQLPFLVAAALGWVSWEWAADYIILQLMYGYAYQAFAITHNFGIHWSLGIALSIADMICGQFGGSLIDDFLK